MAKKVYTRPEWITARQVKDIYSVSNCISKEFCDYINDWMHNGYWFFDSPDIIRRVAEKHSADLSNTHLFYYEVYEKEFNEDTYSWELFSSEPAFQTEVVVPGEKYLDGFDIVSFSTRTSPECSPLSCNNLASSIETNSHCLLGSFNVARDLLMKGSFINSEPGPYRIFAIYTVKWP